jgi:hypothetical protein
MLDLANLPGCRPPFSSFFDNLVCSTAAWKKGFDIGRSLWSSELFLDNLRKDIFRPYRSSGPYLLKFNLLEQIIDLLKSVIFDELLIYVCQPVPRPSKDFRPEATFWLFVEVFCVRWYKQQIRIVNDHDKVSVASRTHIDETGTDALKGTHWFNVLLLLMVGTCRKSGYLGMLVV